MRSTALFVPFLVLISVLVASASTQITINVVSLQINDNEMAINGGVKADHEMRRPDVNVRFEYLANEV